MTDAAKQKIRVLSERTDKNVPMIRRNAAMKDSKENSTIVHSVAKYYGALKTLETE